MDAKRRLLCASAKLLCSPAQLLRSCADLLCSRAKLLRPGPHLLCSRAADLCRSRSGRLRCTGSRRLCCSGSASMRRSRAELLCSRTAILLRPSSELLRSGSKLLQPLRSLLRSPRLEPAEAPHAEAPHAAYELVWRQRLLLPADLPFALPADLLRRLLSSAGEPADHHSVGFSMAKLSEGTEREALSGGVLDFPGPTHGKKKQSSEDSRSKQLRTSAREMRR